MDGVWFRWALDVTATSAGEEGDNDGGPKMSLHSLGVGDGGVMGLPPVIRPGGAADAAVALLLGAGAGGGPIVRATTGGGKGIVFGLRPTGSGGGGAATTQGGGAVTIPAAVKN